MQSKAAITNGKGSFSIEIIEVNEPENDEVLVKIMASGICHTDWDSQNWGKQLVMGHEGAGVVVAVGDKVKSINIGDKVMLNWAIPCDECFQCLEGNVHICERNSSVTSGNNRSGGHANFTSTTWKKKPIEKAFSLGTMAEYTLVREAACTIIEVEMPFTSAAIVGCGVMTGFGSVINVAKVKPGSTVVVLGAGGVGLNVIQGARIAKAKRIIAIDVNPRRLSMALGYGANTTLLAQKDDIGLLKAAKNVKSFTENRGADYAFECTAIPELGAAPLAMIRNGGTAVQVSGIEQPISFDMNLFEWDKVYINPLYGQCNPKIDFPKLQKLYETGELLLDQMVTKCYPLEQLSQAFEDMHNGKNAKGVITFHS